ncbi:MAG: MGMT family protein [Clostridia bacterium]|nr:MGMT family protein [Clostridia bacterium]MBN2882472.1 MGMT family protein [Clostridia bacterium]
MNEFDERIYKLALLVPKGNVASYGQLAAMAGKPQNSRAVGRAMKNAPSGHDIPCHRVVNQNGEIAPSHVFESKKHQRAMLEAEGVVFKSNGKIDMKKSQWKPL